MRGPCTSRPFIPRLHVMRDVLMHMEDYGVDAGHRENVGRRQSRQVAPAKMSSRGSVKMTPDGTSSLSIDIALSAAEALLGAIRAIAPGATSS